MPIYEYKCREHGHVFEVRQGFNDPERESCEICQGPVDRLVSVSAFHLKGGGWYTTDYKATGAKQGKESEKAAPAKVEPAASEASPKDKKNDIN